MGLQEKEIISASAVVNYLLNKPELKDKITNLFLQKALYFIHGFALALIGKPIVNESFGEFIEAWKLGPVIPSIYHEFKINKSDFIPNESQSILIRELEMEEEEYIKPILKNPKIIQLIEWVYENFFLEEGKLITAEALVEISHTEDAPWHQVYKESINAKILNSSIEHYFKWYYNWLCENSIVEKF